MSTIPPGGAAWTFTLANPTGENVGSLLAATSRKLTFYLDQACTAAFTMPGEHPETALVDELAVDVIAARNGVNLFRGRIGNSTDTLTADTITTTFAALDYRGMLDRRILWAASTRSFRQADQADIAWQMISDTQALPGGGLGITRGAAADTGTLRDRDYDAGKSLGEALTQLGQTEGGFNWEIDAARRFNLYYPSRGRQTGLVLTYGRDIVGLTRSFDATQFANAIRFNGSSTTTADEVAVTTWDPEVGRWDGQRSDPNLVLQATVDQRSAYELANASVETPAYQVTMAAGAWDPNLIWVGDTVQLIAQDGRLDVNTTQRIVQIDVTLSDDGDEAVVLSVQAAPAALTTRLVSYNTRLNNLERVAGYIPDVPVGGMYDWPGSTPPPLCMWCDGSVLNIAQYPDLFAVLSTTYGGNGTTTFALPDCRGRMTVAAGTGYAAGTTGGAATVTLTVAEQNAPHFHNINVNSANPNVDHNHPFTATSAGRSADHTHGPGSLVTSGQNNNHAHSFGMLQANFAAAAGTAVHALGNGSTNTGAAGNDHLHNVAGGASGGASVDHTHAVSGTSGLTNQPHIHNVAGPSGTSAGGTAHENMPPYIAIGKVIKVLAPQNQ